MSNHRLLTQLTQSDCTEEEIQELYADLQFIYSNPFDEVITAAVTRGCAYIEQPQDRAN